MRLGRVGSLLIIAACAGGSGSAVASAETIHLNGDKQIEGEILERNEGFVRIRTEKIVIRLPVARLAPRALEGISQARQALESGEIETARRAIEIELFWSPADAEAIALLKRIEAAEAGARAAQSHGEARSFLAEAGEEHALAKARASAALTTASSEAALATLRDLEHRVRSRAAAAPEGPTKEDLAALATELREDVSKSAGQVLASKGAAERALANDRREQMIRAQRYASQLQRGRRASRASRGKVVLNPPAGRSSGSRALGGSRIQVGVEAGAGVRGGPRGAISGGGIGSSGGMRVRAQSR